MSTTLQASCVSAPPVRKSSLVSALKVSELQCRRMFETAGDGLLILECDQCRITDANPFRTELLGYSQSELLGKQLWEIGLLEKEAARQALSQIKQGGYLRYELPLKTHRGDKREVEFVAGMAPSPDVRERRCSALGPDTWDVIESAPPVWTSTSPEVKYQPNTSATPSLGSAM